MNVRNFGLAAAAVVALSALAGAAGAQSISIKGSDTMLPLGQAWAAGYMKAKGGSTVTVTGGGSTTGIAALINGSCDIAQASRSVKGSEVESAKGRGFVPFEVPAARDGLAIIVNPANPIAKLSIPQLRAIYSGAAKSWKDVGGQNVGIITVGRDSSSGTYGFFQDSVLGVGRPYRADMQTSPSTNAIAQVVAQDAGAIGYVGIAYAAKFAGKVKVISISRAPNAPAIEPSKANVLNGKYPLWRYLFFYTRGRASGAAKAFIDWVRSPAGQGLVEEVGYYSL